MFFGSFCASFLGHINNKLSCFISYIHVDMTLLQDFRQNGDDATIDILVRLKQDKITAIKQECLLKKFKLTRTISTSNMHLFDAEGKIKKYDNPEQSIKPSYNGIIWDNVVFFGFHVLIVFLCSFMQLSRNSIS